MAQQETSQPKQLELLKKLIGEWQVGVIMKTQDGTVLSGSGTMISKETAGGFCVSTEINLDIEGFGVYAEHDLWSYDRWTDKLHLFSVTSSGAVHDHVGNWKNDKTLELEWVGIYEDKDTKEEIQVQWLNLNEIKAYETDYTEGKQTLTAEYIFRRK